MSCYHPLPAIYEYGYSQDCKRVKVCSRNNPPAPYIHPSTGELVEPMQIPCGKCIGCRLDYSRAWADRLTMESLDYPKDKVWFLTLTYDDDHLPSPSPIVQVSSLVPRDLELFMKRLRERWCRVYGASHIRFYGAGEYGSTTFRPHYHLILYGLELYDLVFHSANFDGDPLYSSSELDEVWGNGFTLVAPFSWNTAAYTARYVVKKLKGPNAMNYYKSAGLVPEFVRMSRRPGIGSRFLNVNLERLSQNDYVQLPDGKSCVLPKYALRLLDKKDPLARDRIRKQRMEARENVERELKRLTDLSSDSYLKLQEENKLIAIKKLQRKDL